MNDEALARLIRDLEAELQRRAEITGQAVRLMVMYEPENDGFNAAFEEWTPAGHMGKPEWKSTDDFVLATFSAEQALSKLLNRRAASAG